MPEEKVSFATGLYKMGATLGGAFGIALNTIRVYSMPTILFSRNVSNDFILSRGNYYDTWTYISIYSDS